MGATRQRDAVARRRRRPRSFWQYSSVCLGIRAGGRAQDEMLRALDRAARARSGARANVGSRAPRTPHARTSKNGADGHETSCDRAPKKVRGRHWDEPPYAP